MDKGRQGEGLARSVGLALTAGMFSIVPTAFGAPVQDTSVSTSAAISQAANAAQTGKDTTISSAVQSNVIGWKDFSVKRDEKVTFDDKNYMNIVTGANTSEIDGIVSGGGDVYVVNPNGVIFGKDAQVNVGNLYVSTRYVDPAAAAAAAGNDDLHSVLETAAPGVAMDVVNLGAISATKVEVEGANIRFVSDGVTPTRADVTLRADGANGGYIHVGNAAGADVHYTAQNLADAASPAPVATGTADYYKTINGANWSDIQSGLSGNYMLMEDIDASASSTAFAPVTGTFSGKFDGMFHTIRNMTIADGHGLFEKAEGTSVKRAEIYNLGIADSSIAGTDDSVGAVVGEAVYTKLQNVWNDHSTVAYDDYMTGGLIGRAEHVSLDSVYSTGDTEGGGLIGLVEDGDVSIDHSYVISSSADARYGFVNDVQNASLTIDHSYFKSASTASSMALGAATIRNSLLINSVQTLGGVSGYTSMTYNASGVPAPFDPSGHDWTKQAEYTILGGTVSNAGGVAIEPTGKVTRPAWRIYEGQSLPVLTSMTKGIRTVDYDFQYYGENQIGVDGKVTGKDYTKQDTQYAGSAIYAGGKNGGKDLPALSGTSTDLSTGLVYNGDYMKIVGTDRQAVSQDDLKGTGAVRYADGSAFDETIHYAKDGTEYGRKNATDLQALLYTDPMGYDIVGGNVSIARRTVDANVDVASLKIVKEYDGTADAGAQARQAVLDRLVVGGANATTGIVEGDSDRPAVSFVPTAAFTHGKNVQALTPGAVSISGTISLTGANDNYVIKGAGTGNTKAISGTAQGAIYQKTITLSAKNAGALNKAYDGDAIVKDGSGTAIDVNAVEASGESKYFTINGKVTADAVALTADANAVYVDDDGVTENKNAGAHKVRFSGIALGGADAGNYVLVDKDDTSKYIYSQNAVIGADGMALAAQPVTAGQTGVYFSTGKITPRQLAITDYFYADTDPAVLKTVEADGTAYREYDATADLKEAQGKTVNRAGASGILSGDALTFTVAAAKFVTAQQTGTETKDAGAAAAVRYTIAIAGADAKNYNFDGSDTGLVSGASGTVYGKGRIDPRTLYLTANAAKQAAKDYDGDDAVKVKESDGSQRKALTFGDGLISYAVPSDAAHQLISGDTDQIVYTGLYQQTGTEGAADVNWNNGVQDKNIRYTVSVQHADGSASTNYTIVNGTVPTGSETYTAAINGTGRIDQKELTNLQMGFVQKIYDTSAAVNGGVQNVSGGTNTNTVETALEGATANGLVGTEKIRDVFDDTKIRGAYGRGSADFTENAHVSRDAGNTPANTAVRYVGDTVDGTGAHHETSLADAIKNHNYKLAAGVLGADGSLVQADGGRVNPLEIDSVTVAADHATKIYDASADILAPTGYEAEGAAYYLTDHATNRLHTMTATSNGNALTLDYRVMGGQYAGKDSHNGTAQNVTYALKIVENGDYALKSTLKDGAGNYLYTMAGGGTITPKTVYASATKDPLEKVYDGTTDAAVSGNAAVTLAGLIDGTNASTARYDDKNAGTGKTVNYAVALDAATQALGNYYIVERGYTGNDPAHNTITALTGMGTITPKDLTLSFKTLTKTYDGTDALTVQNETDIDAADFVTYGGLVTADDVTVDKAKLKTAVYGKKMAGATTLDYTVGLGGADKGNYKLMTAREVIDPMTGTKTLHQSGAGEITKKSLGAGDAAVTTFAPISKVYDGATDVAYNHESWQYGQGGAGKKKKAADFVNTLTIGGISLAKGTDYTVVSGKYADAADAGAKNADFTITFSNDIENSIDLSSVAATDAAGRHTLTATADAANGSPTIETQIVVAAIAKNPTKIYDATTDLRKNSTQTGAGTALNPYADGYVTLSRADGSTGTAAWTAAENPTVTGHYASKDVKLKADGSADTQAVSYTATIGGSNYKLVDAKNSANTGIGALTLTGAGTIEQKEISAAVADITKVYDGTSAATPANIAAATGGASVTGAVGGDTFGTIFNTGLITGYYGKTDAAGSPVYDAGGVLVADGNVRRVVGVPTSKPTAFSAASGDIRDAMILNSFGSSNYRLAGGKKAIEGRGTITPKGLSAADITVSWKPISREYDGTSYAQTSSADDQNYTEDKAKEKQLLTLTTNINGAAVSLDYDLTGAVFDRTDAGNGTVTYTIARLADKELGNFEIGADVAPWLTNAMNWTHAGTITPRVLKKGGVAAVSKVYDGTTAVDTAGNIAKSDQGVTALENLPFTRILAQDAANGVRVEMDTSAGNQAVFDHENASRAASLAGATKVTYHAVIQGDAKNNYTFAGGSGAPNTHALQYEGVGTITPKDLVVSAAVTGIDKEYDGTAAINAAGAAAIKSEINANAANWAGIISRGGALDNVTLDTVTAAYTDAHVQREADGSVQDNKKTITLTPFSFTLGGTHRENYRLAFGSVTATGKITPKVLTVTGPTRAEKVYDGTNEMENPRTHFTTSGAVGSDSVVLGVAGHFDAVNVDDTMNPATGAENVTDKAVYNLSIENGDYALLGAAAPTPYAMEKTVKGEGKITPYTLTVSALDVTKPYDATTALPNAAGTYLSTDKPLNGDAVTVTADGAFGGSDAGGYANDVHYTHLAIDPMTNTHGNYVLDAAQERSGVLGNGTITARELSIAAADIAKVYDGTTVLKNGSTSLVDAAGNLTSPLAHFTIAGLQGSDTAAGLGLAATGTYRDANVSTADPNGPGAVYTVSLVDKNYVLRDRSGTLSQTAELDGRGRITPRTLSVEAARAAEKVYDTTRDVKNAADNLVLKDGDTVENFLLAADRDNVSIQAAGTYQDANVDGRPGENRVDYTRLALDNPNYQLDTDHLDDQKGTITRRKVTATAAPAARYVGEALTGFSGTLSIDDTGASADEIAAMRGELAAYAADFDWETPDALAASAVPGEYGIYGAYHGGLSGGLGQNYTFGQDLPFNDTALNVQMLDPGAEYHAAATEGLVRPDRTVYAQVLKNEASGYIIEPRYAVTYAKDGIGNGKDAGTDAFVAASEQGRGEEQEGASRKAAAAVDAGDAVNLTGGDRMAEEDVSESLAM